MSEDPGPFALLRDLCEVSERLADGPPGAELESLIMRRADLIKDLLFYRFYGFRADFIENLIVFDPAVQAMYAQIAREEEQANVLARQRRQGSTESSDTQAMGKPGPGWRIQIE